MRKEGASAPADDFGAVEVKNFTGYVTHKGSPASERDFMSTMSALSGFNEELRRVSAGLRQPKFARI